MTLSRRKFFTLTAGAAGVAAGVPVAAKVEWPPTVLEASRVAIYEDRLIFVSHNTPPQIYWTEQQKWDRW